MKKIFLSILMACATVTGLFAQKTVYVSAKGIDSNSGDIETAPVKTIITAIIRAMTDKEVNRILVTGILDAKSEELGVNSERVFSISDPLGLIGSREIIITGRPNVAIVERAVLSAKGSNKTVAAVSDLKIRFENIEISGGEGEYGVGLFITNNAQVTLGLGAVVRGNSGIGIAVDNGTCTIDGGDVNNNNRHGVAVGSYGIVNLKSGAIRDNSARGNGGGALVDEGGRFTMSGGSITNNRTGTSNDYVGGGVAVGPGGQFTLSGGSITNNRAQGAGGGVGVLFGGSYSQSGGTISGNLALLYHDIFVER